MTKVMHVCNFGGSFNVCSDLFRFHDDTFVILFCLFFSFLVVLFNFIQTCLMFYKMVHCEQTKTTRGSHAKKKIMFLHSKNKASRKGYKCEC